VTDQPRALLGGGTHPEAENRTWFPGIEALRALAALAVVVEHCWALARGVPSFGFGIVPGLGNWGVDIFFLLSGFLLADFFWTDRRRPAREFYVRRFFRIAPAYYVCVGILTVFFVQHSLLFSPAGFKGLLALLTFTQWLWPTTSTNLNVNGSLWTLTIEMILYLTLPLLAWLIAKRPVLASLGLVALGAGYRLMVALDGAWLQQLRVGNNQVPTEIARLFLSRQFLGILPIFVLGIALRWAVIHGKLDRVLQWRGGPKSRPNLLILLVLLVPSLVFLRGLEPASYYEHWVRFTYFDYTVALLAVPALLYASRPISAELPRHMVPAVWMGERSYGLYLWHFPVILSIYGIGSSGNPPDLHHLPVKIVLIFVISIALAWGSYSLVELPAREYGRRVARRVGSRAVRGDA